ncbi:regulatory protein [Salmonella enterica subsp. enterica]|nr:regulatory protein [Salmonella enterica subsp. enterica]
MASTNQELASALRMFSRFFDLIHQPLAVINERGEYVLLQSGKRGSGRL